jgi:putative redox protein
LVTAHSTTTPYRTRFSVDGHEAYSDASEAKGGAGEGFGPHALLEASVACCISIWLRMYADKNGIPLREVTADVRLNRQSPRDTVFEYSVDLRGELTAEQQDELRQQAAHCPVSETLLKRISFRDVSAGEEFPHPGPSSTSQRGSHLDEYKS